MTPVTGKRSSLVLSATSGRGPAHSGHAPLLIVTRADGVTARRCQRPLVLIMVNQRCGQFPLQLYGLMCQTSNSSQQLLIAGHRQGHVAAGGGTSSITRKLSSERQYIHSIRTTSIKHI